jgi:PadR family transcriptional regulator, regulatory protein AphA
MSYMSLRHAIIGFLCIEPMSGYTLQKRFEATVASYWSVTQSQIYRELHSLQADGLVSVETIPGDGKPAQKVYSPTLAGRTVFEKWLSEPVEPQSIRHPLLLKLSFAGHQPPMVAQKLLKEYIRELESIEREYRSRVGASQIFGLAASTREALLWRLILDNGLSWVHEEQTWAENALREWTEAM